MTDQAKLNRKRVNRHEQRKRDQGLVQRKRWAHPEDWPAIDRYIERKNKARH